MKLLILTFLLIFSSLSFSQNITQSQKDSVISRIKMLVGENYVITNNIKTISDSLNTSNYSNIDSIPNFVKKINSDLARYSNDKHLFVQYDPEAASKMLIKEDIHKDDKIIRKKSNYGFDKVEILKGNIGYLKMTAFEDVGISKATALKSMIYFKNTKVLIIDMRGNFGGNGSMIELLSSFFLDKSQSELLKISYKSGNTVILKNKEIKAKYKYNKPVYILCDSNTFSAAEAFTFILKNRKRATVLGETTAGAGNVAGPHPINNEFVITIPAGTIVDAITNTGWEHCGVTPNIIIESKKALDKALEMIGGKL